MNPIHLFYRAVRRTMRKTIFNMMTTELVRPTTQNVGLYSEKKSHIEEKGVIGVSSSWNLPLSLRPDDYDEEDYIMFGKVPVGEILILAESSLPTSMTCDKALIIEETSIPDTPDLLSFEFKLEPYIPSSVSWGRTSMKESRCGSKNTIYRMSTIELNTIEKTSIEAFFRDSDSDFNFDRKDNMYMDTDTNTDMDMDIDVESQLNPDPDTGAS